LHSASTAGIGYFVWLAEERRNGVFWKKNINRCPPTPSDDALVTWTLVEVDLGVVFREESDHFVDNDCCLGGDRYFRVD
jgi:hypothetical protein